MDRAHDLLLQAAEKANAVAALIRAGVSADHYDDMAASIADTAAMYANRVLALLGEAKRTSEGE